MIDRSAEHRAQPRRVVRCDDAASVSKVDRSVEDRALDASNDRTREKAPRRPVLLQDRDERIGRDVRRDDESRSLQQRRPVKARHVQIVQHRQRIEDPIAGAEIVEVRRDLHGQEAGIVKMRDDLRHACRAAGELKEYNLERIIAKLRDFIVRFRSRN